MILEMTITQFELEEMIGTFKAVRDHQGVPNDIQDKPMLSQNFRRGWVYALDAVLAYLEQFDDRLRSESDDK